MELSINMKELERHILVAASRQATLAEGQLQTHCIYSKSTERSHKVAYNNKNILLKYEKKSNGKFVLSYLLA